MNSVDFLEIGYSGNDSQVTPNCVYKGMTSDMAPLCFINGGFKDVTDDVTPGICEINLKRIDSRDWSDWENVTDVDTEREWRVVTQRECFPGIVKFQRIERLSLSSVHCRGVS